ncbi:hypothetical protein B0H17DRAFT_922293 [Mycena rosella]|uniref:Smr domain-containing protein n=1 Tax=Mycena rosella TaxID=1033263 RepID=A0AAD7GNS9_MYCRO|nr:hypothetical protein B0H17DRAFT_922293 [Mycena rosella]
MCTSAHEAHNLRKKDGEIDVHGLFVPEAIKKVTTALQTAILDGRKDLRVIVGKGLHSKDNRPRLRPEIMKEMERQNIPCHIHASNAGVLILTVPS